MVFADETLNGNANLEVLIEQLIQHNKALEERLEIVEAQLEADNTTGGGPGFSGYYNGTQWDDLANRVTTVTLPWTRSGAHYL